MVLKSISSGCTFKKKCAIVKTYKNKVKGDVMSFTKEKREQIKRYILEKVDAEQKDIAKKTSDTFEISLNTVYRYIRELEKDKIIEKRENEYKFVEKVETFILDRDAGELKEEDDVYERRIKKYILGLPDNVRKIWEYSFMEMMNNAIDHSEAKFVMITVRQSYMNTYIFIGDTGVGIFRKIKEFYGYESLDDAVNELFKGKLTTDSKNHSGEGIFFTSRVLDKFAALSDGKMFTHDKYVDVLQNLDEIAPLVDLKNNEGTIIMMKLSNFSNKKLVEVFDMYADVNGGFTRTHIPIKNIYETYPVSRSQAKRLCNRFDKFEEVELDFKEVDEVGQGFAHEIFVVFQNMHPEVKIIPVNMSETVKKMINHVILTKN